MPVCQFGGECTAGELSNIRSLLIDLARTGFRALSLTVHSELVDGSSWALRDFIASAHRSGMKVLVRLALPGALLCSDGCDADEVVQRVNHALSCGADGIDIDVLDAPGPGRTELGQQRLSQFIHLLHAEIADQNPQAILTAETLSSDVRDIDFHLQEHWFHHLRDGALLFSTWDDQDLRRRVTSVLQHRDALGHVANWHCSYSSNRYDEAVRTSYLPWRQEFADQRPAALTLFALSLPGSASILFRHMGGRVVTSAGKQRRIWSADLASSREATMMRSALRVREEHAMGTGSLAWVDNLPWAHQGVSVHMSAGVTVVLNTSVEDVVVPGEHVLLVSSDPYAEFDPAGTVVVPNSCAWFDTARVKAPTINFFGD